MKNISGEYVLVDCKHAYKAVKYNFIPMFLFFIKQLIIKVFLSHKATIGMVSTTIRKL